MSRLQIANLPDLSYNYQDDTGLTALSVAAKAGRVDAIRKLLGIAEVDRNATDFSGWTALHHASAEGHGDAVAALLNAGVDDSVADFRCRKAVDVARERGDLGVLKAFRTFVREKYPLRQHLNTDKKEAPLMPSYSYITLE